MKVLAGNDQLAIYYGTRRSIAGEANALVHLERRLCMRKFKMFVVVAVCIVMAAVILWAFRNAWRPPESSRIPGPMLPIKAEPVVAPFQPDYARFLASSIAERMSEEVLRYRQSHGRIPTPNEFWDALETAPIHNPINGSAGVVGRTEHFESNMVGWIIDESTGTVYPGFLYQGRE